MSDVPAGWTPAMERTLLWTRRLALLLMGVVCLGGAVAMIFFLGTPNPAPLSTFETPSVLIGAGLLLILAASRLQTLVQRRAARLSATTLEAMVAGWAQGVAASWLLLVAASGLGLAAAVLTGRRVTALAFVAAALLGIVVRWPQRCDMLRRATIALGDRA